MIKTTETFISVPKTRNAQMQVLVNGEDKTSQVAASAWSKPLLSLGIGGFTLKLNNPGGIISSRYTAGQVVQFIADNSTKTRIQFKGRIDFPRENLTSDGQYLEIVGRHRSYFLSERRVAYTATQVDCGQVLINIIALFASEIDSTNVELTGVLTDVNYDYKTFQECINDLMQKSGYDARIDDDLKLYFFAANSVLNENEAVAEGDNFISSPENGMDDYYEKTRVTVIGQDDQYIPIVYTAINGIDDTTTGREDEGIREVFIRDTSLNTYNKVVLSAQAELVKYTNRAPQGQFYSYGLETLSPGENLWISVPRQRIMGQYKALEITHLFGRESAGWRTQLTTEFRPVDTKELINITIKKNENITNADNYNKLNYSYNFPYDDNSLTESASNCSVSNGKLVLDAGQTTGTWTSLPLTANTNIVKIELRIVGANLEGSLFYYSIDNGKTWTQFYNRVAQVPTQVGKQLKVKVTLNTYFSAGPELLSMAALYS